MAMFRLERVDENNNGVPLPFTNEIVQYSTAKYITGNETIWLFFEFAMSDQSSCVTR